MATFQKAIKVGSSVAAVLPKALLKETGISAGSQITVEAVDGGVLIRPTRKAPRRAQTEDERVAATALGLITRYKNALERLADA
jgi:antitoxin component of MazEF toxin-antitoxin module